MILRNAKQALKKSGCIFLIEKILPNYSYKGDIFDMHMLACTGGQERSDADYAVLLHREGLCVDSKKELNGSTFLFVAFFGEENGYIRTAYKTYEEKGKPLPLCSLTKDDVLAFAKREIVTTIGLRCKAHFHLNWRSF